MRYIIVLFIISLTGCGSVKISDVNKVDDFSISQYKTFNFFEIGAEGDAIGPNYRENVEYLKKAIVKEMGLKGLSVSNDEPELLVNIGIVVSEEVQTRETSFSNPADRQYMGTRNYSWQSSEVAVGKYRQGSITVDLVDRKANKMVWQGTAESVIPNKEKNVPPLIENGMKKLFEKLE